MKKIMISVAIFIATNGFAQMTETKKLATGKGGWEIEMNIKNGTDTSTYFYYSFQNMEYSHIIDRGSIFFSKQKDLIAFADALKVLAGKESGARIQLKVDEYSLRLSDVSNYVYIEDEKGKYTYFTKKTAIKMADEFIANAKLLRE